MKKEVEIRLRREHIPNGVKSRPNDFWLIYNSNNNSDRSIENPRTVECLDDIFQTNSKPEARDHEITSYLQTSGILSEEHKVKSYWLPSVNDALSSPVKLFFNPSGECPNSCLTCFAEELTQATLGNDVAREALNQTVEMPIFWMNLGGCELSLSFVFLNSQRKLLKMAYTLRQQSVVLDYKRNGLSK